MLLCDDSSISSGEVDFAIVVERLHIYRLVEGVDGGSRIRHIDNCDVIDKASVICNDSNTDDL